MTRRGVRLWLTVLVLLVVAAAGIGWVAYDKLFRREIPTYAADVDQFKYGSIGNDGETGVPYLIWRVLPRVFPDHLPGPGGYASLGLTWEPGHDRNDAPVGFSRARVGFERIAINCAFCHTTIVRLTPTGDPAIYPGGPSNIIDVLGYQRFLLQCASDPRFTPDVLLAAIEQEVQLSGLDRLIYRLVIIPLTKKRLLEQKAQFAWTDKRPVWGPGRIDPFNPVKFGMLGLPDDGTIGNSHMQAVWGLDAREAIRPNAPLHWDGLNTSIHEVVVSSALGDGATAGEFDWTSIDRVERFLRASHAPPSPFKPDEALAKRGEVLFAQNCGECHAKNGARTLTIVPLAEIGTDRHRMDMWTALARDAYNNYRKGYDWGFKSFQKVEGYVAEPLDGIWLKAPYLHNGSVPSLADLLKKADQRPKVFLRGSALYDKENIGFEAPPCTPGQASIAGFCYDTSQPGNAATGHSYGTALSADDKAALIAYLQTL